MIPRLGIRRKQIIKHLIIRRRRPRQIRQSRHSRHGIHALAILLIAIRIRVHIPTAVDVRIAVDHVQCRLAIHRLRRMLRQRRRRMGWRTRIVRHDRDGLVCARP